MTCRRRRISQQRNAGRRHSMCCRRLYPSKSRSFRRWHPHLYLEPHPRRSHPSQGLRPCSAPRLMRSNLRYCRQLRGAAYRCRRPPHGRPQWPPRHPIPQRQPFLLRHRCCHHFRPALPRHRWRIRPPRPARRSRGCYSILSSPALRIERPPRHGSLHWNLSYCRWVCNRRRSW